MMRRVLLTLLGIVLLIGLSGFSYYTLNRSPDIFEASKAGLYNDFKRESESESLRSTKQGDIVGFEDSYNTYAWLGIPYASAPVGDLRWKAPRAAKAWQGVQEALNYGAPCLQYWGILAGTEGEAGEIVGNEDCLTLNIWAPKPKEKNKSDKKKPVMVWIHGGGNDTGTANTYQAHHLAGEKDVVVVLINYRLGLLGWFSHESLRNTSDNPLDASGNFGTLDIISALKWVQDNISEFGGDSNNVTIFGESAGGRNVYSMLASPLASGLFHKAIIQSGSADTTLKVLAEDHADNRLTASSFGLINSSNGLISQLLSQDNPELNDASIREKAAEYSDAALLRKLRSTDPKEMMRLAASNFESNDDIKVARVIRDGVVIPKQSVISLLGNAENYNSVPLMVGSNRDENKLYMIRDPKYVERSFGLIPKIKDTKRYSRVSEYVSQNWKAGAVDEPAKQIVKHATHPVFAYRFDWDEEPNGLLGNFHALLGASHGLEISYVFGDFKGGVAIDVIWNKQNAPGRKQLSLSMMDYWAQFAHTGSPERGMSGQQRLWQPWTTSGNNLMLLDTEADGGTRMSEVRTNVADIKERLTTDDVLHTSKERCEAYAALFLHGYQASDFWSPEEYQTLGCSDFPVGEFRKS